MLQQSFSFLLRSEFSQKITNNKILTAEIGSRLINTRDAFGVCARGAEQYANDIFFIFRGTTGGHYGADIVTDLRMGLTICSSGSFVHSGFNQTFSSMIPDLACFMASQRQVRTIHCIGHSLGGAVATLAADWASEHYNAAIKLYTFGAPRVGFGITGFASKLTTKLSVNNIYRVYHDTDPVPMVPVFPYVHAPTKGMDYCLHYGGLVIHPPAHFMDGYVQSV
ncbi:MAG: lipase family protein, partial [Gammaproteobacteria bacterium]